MFNRIKKALKDAYNYFFSVPAVPVPDDNKTSVHDFSNVIQFIPREKIPARIVPASAPIVETIPENKRDLKKEYEEWKNNMRMYDKIRQSMAQ